MTQQMYLGGTFPLPDDWPWGLRPRLYACACFAG